MISDAEPDLPSAHTLLSMALGVCLALTALPASAQQPDDGTRAAARDLAAEGIEAYQAQDYASANRMLDKAYRLFATPTLGLWSARARFRIGQWVEAAERYRETQLAESTVGDGAAQRRAQKEASDELAALSPRIPAITIELDNTDTSGVTLELDGARITTELLGVRRPVNPGAHRVVASRGSARAVADVQLSEKEHKRVPLRLLESPETAAPEVQPSIDAASVTGSPSSLDTSPASEGEAAWVRPVAISALAVGGVGLAVTGIAALVGQGKCEDGRCTSESDQASYDSMRTLATVSFWAGALLAAGGAVTWFVGPRLTSAEKPNTLSWGVTPFRVNLKGSF